MEAVPTDVAASVRERLAELADRHGVRVLLAIESGSRAWGFPSPDSDYDVRFLYARPPEWFVSVSPGRDVIEEPEGEIDLNGWDLRKSLGLMLKGNAVLAEWLMSPVTYHEVAAFRAEFRALLEQSSRPAPLIHHYLNLGLSMRRNDAFKGRQLPIKKYFYVLRPAMALRWLRLHPEAAVPPMHFPTLVDEGELPPDAARLIRDLVVAKATTRELGDTEPVPVLEALVDTEFTLAAERAKTLPAIRYAVRADADAFLRRWTLAAADAPAAWVER